MKVNIEVKLKPFQVPNFVLVEPTPGRRDEGMKEPSKFHLSDLDSDSLAKLCDEFRKQVFAKAGKTEPDTCCPSKD